MLGELKHLIENKKLENAKNKLEKLLKQKNISNNQKKLYGFMKNILVIINGMKMAISLLKSLT